MTTYLEGRVEIVKADITRLDVDAIVNAANTSLLGGGGVDGAIHRGAGPELLAECRKLGGARTGEAKITRGYKLPARYVIHTVGPVWHGGERGEPKLLASCYQRSLELAREHSISTLAFPSVSTGVYRYPIEKAARSAQETVRTWLEDNSLPERVIFCCYSDADREVYEEIAGAILAERAF
jgi:O-acetyl-ADP-ribose deacetylase (regulator of RNase III)